MARNGHCLSKFKVVLHKTGCFHCFGEGVVRGPRVCIFSVLGILVVHS